MQNFLDQFYLNFIKDDRWKYLTDGLKTALLITFFAVILGLVLGFLVAIVRSSAVKSGIKKLRKSRRRVFILGSCWAIICLSLWILSASFT